MVLEDLSILTKDRSTLSFRRSSRSSLDNSNVLLLRCAGDRAKDLDPVGGTGVEFVSSDDLCVG